MIEAISEFKNPNKPSHKQPPAEGGSSQFLIRQAYTAAG